MINVNDFVSSCFSLFLMFYLYTTSMITFYIPVILLYGFDWFTTSYIVFFSFTYILMLISYALASLETPGIVPSSYIDLYPSKEFVENLPKNSKRPRWCNVCNFPKPPRTHHCSACNKCVLKMDHHCTHIYIILRFLVKYVYWIL